MCAPTEGVCLCSISLLFSVKFVTYFASINLPKERKQEKKNLKGTYASVLDKSENIALSLVTPLPPFCGVLSCVCVCVCVCVCMCVLSI